MQEKWGLLTVFLHEAGQATYTQVRKKASSLHLGPGVIPGGFGQKMLHNCVSCAYGLSEAYSQT